MFLRGVDVHVSGTAKDAKVGEVRVATSEGGEGNDRGSFRPGAVAKVDHGEKSEAPKVVRETSSEKEGLGTVRKCAPLALNTGELPVSVGDSALNCNRRGPTDCGESCTEKDGVVVDAEDRRMVAKGRDGGEDLSKRRGSVRLTLKKNSNDGCGSVADSSKDVAVAGGIWRRRWATNVQSQGVERMRRITITSRSAIDVRNCGLGSSTVRAKRERRELGETEDTRDAEAVKLKEACFVEVTHTAMDKVSSRSRDSSEKGWRDRG